jgi:PAS domain-containing protein
MQEGANRNRAQQQARSNGNRRLLRTAKFNNVEHPMELEVEKDLGAFPYVLSQILDTCINGITLSDPDQPDNPLVYANEAFELITGYDRRQQAHSRTMQLLSRRRRRAKRQVRW